MLIFPRSITLYYTVRSRQKKPIRNTSLLKLHISCLQILAIIPLNVKSVKSKVFASSILLPLITASFLSTFVVLGREHYILFEKVLGLLACITVSLLFGVILYSNWTSCRTWSNLLEIIFECDETFFKEDPTLYSKNKTILKFLVVYSLPFAYLFLDVILRTIAKKGYVEYLLLVTQHIGNLYKYQIALFFWEFAIIFQSRYAHLKEQLCDILQVNKQLHPEMSEYMIRRRIQKFKSKYTILHSAIEQVNEIFGWIIIFLITHVVAIFLLVLYIILYTLGKQIILRIDSCLMCSAALVSVGVLLFLCHYESLIRYHYQEF